MTEPITRTSWVLFALVIFFVIFSVWQTEKMSNLNEQLNQKDDVIEHHISSIKACENVLLDLSLDKKNITFVVNWTG